jgi:hypothetical protein
MLAIAGTAFAFILLISILHILRYRLVGITISNGEAYVISIVTLSILEILFIGTVLLTSQLRYDWVLAIILMLIQFAYIMDVVRNYNTPYVYSGLRGRLELTATMITIVASAALVFIR